MLIAVVKDLATHYANETGDRRATTAAEIVKQGYATLGADGAVVYSREVRRLAPRLAPVPEDLPKGNDFASKAGRARARVQAIRDMQSRLAETLPSSESSGLLPRSGALHVREKDVDAEQAARCKQSRERHAAAHARLKRK